MSTKANAPTEESHEEKKAPANSPKYPGIRVTCNGNFLVGQWVETRITEGGIFYPITPSTEGGIAQVKAACDGDLDRVVRIVKLGGFVNSTPDFTDQPKVVNGASDLMVEVFGDKGKHARFAVGAAVLPLGIAVEVDAIVEIA